jgi:hypothetical protein
VAANGNPAGGHIHLAARPTAAPAAALRQAPQAGPAPWVPATTAQRLARPARRRIRQLAMPPRSRTGAGLPSTQATAGPVRPAGSRTDMATVPAPTVAELQASSRVHVRREDWSRQAVLPRARPGGWWT